MSWFKRSTETLPPTGTFSGVPNANQGEVTVDPVVVNNKDFFLSTALGLRDRATEARTRGDEAGAVKLEGQAAQYEAEAAAIK